MENTNTEKSSLVGLRVRQVKTNIPGMEYAVGRVATVEEEFVDEKGVTHVATDDGYWCPQDLLEVVKGE